MIGAGERDETFWMLGSREYLAGIVEADIFVGRRMKDKQRLVQRGDALLEVLFSDVLQEALSDLKRTTGQGNLDLAKLADRGKLVLEQPGDVGRIARCADRHHRPGFRYL